MIDGFAIYRKDTAGITSSVSRNYTVKGILLSQTDGRGNTTTTETDVAGRVLTKTNAAGNVTTTAYDTSHDLPTAITDAQGNTICYRYDVRGRKVAEWGAATQPACFGYDDANNLVLLKTFRVGTETISSDPTERIDGDETTWVFDAATGLELSKTYADNTSVVKTYDCFNRLATETDARGLVKTNNYETARGLLLSTSYSNGDITRSYAYNHLALLTQVTDDAGVRTIGYNTYGEQETDSLLAGGVTHLITETRDAMGRSTGFTYAKNGTVQHTVTTGYGDDGRICSAGFLHGGAEKQFGYGYLPGSNLLQKLTMPCNMTLTQSYETQRDLLTGMAYKRGNTGVSERAYTYDVLGRPLTRRTARKGTTVNDTFAYNTRSELTEAAVNGTAYSYAYDNIGNRESVQEAAEEATAYTANALNQYTAIQQGTEEAFVPTYDADGNQTLVKTSTGIWNVDYNAEHRPTRFVSEDGSTIIECTYDSYGRRSTKKVTKNDQIVLHQRFAYRGFLQIACCDLTRTNEPCLWFITWDPTQAKSTRPLAIQKDGTWYAYAWDLTKNICEIFGQHGYIQTTYSYSPYGQVISDGDVTQPMQWSSEFCDEELGLTYYNFRYYNPSSGKWLSRDRVRNPNLYSFANNTPTSSIDILGLDVYWASRDLAGSPIGNHHFIIMTFSKPEDSPDPSNTLMLKCNECKIIYFVIYALFKTDSGKVEIRINDGFKKDGTNNIDSDVRSFVEFFCQTEGFWRDDDYQGNKIEPPKGKTREEFERDISESAKESKEYFEEHPTEYDLWDENCATWVNDLMEHVGVSEQAREDGGEFFGVDVGEEDTAFSDSFKKN